jgi:hypothetical protein
MIKSSLNGYPDNNRCLKSKGGKPIVITSDEKVTPKVTPYEKVELIESKTCKAMWLLASWEVTGLYF